MAKHPETMQMELAVESVASANRRNFWTKQDVVQSFLKRNAAKRTELSELADLDRRTHDREGREGNVIYVHRERELSRLHNLASRVMHTWDEEQYGLHRRFGCWRARPVNGSSEWRWFEVRYSTATFLQMWRDDKRALYERIGLKVEETDVILALAKAHHTDNINRIYGEAMARITERRAS